MGLTRLLNSLLYFPSRAIVETPDRAGLVYRDLALDTDDGERLHGWWVGARARSRGHLLLCHGNAGNIGDRVQHAALLTAAGFDVLLFDYRGYGRSSGRPGEEGTYRDARAALASLIEQPGIDPARVFYLGESLGGAVALELALERPPAGLVLLSAFTGVRELGRLHFPYVPAALVADVYPSLRRIPGLRAPLLVLHGERDDIVPLSQGRALFEAAPEPKQMTSAPDSATTTSSRSPVPSSPARSPPGRTACCDPSPPPKPGSTGTGEHFRAGGRARRQRRVERG